MKLNEPVSIESIKTRLAALPAAQAGVRHLTLAAALVASLGVGYAGLLAPMQAAVSHADQARQDAAGRQQTLVGEVAALEQMRRENRQLQEDLGRRYPDALSSAEYWQGLTELAAMQRMHLSAFKPETEKTEAMLTSSGAQFIASGNSQATLAFVQAALSGGGLLGADSLALRRTEKGKLALELSLRHYRSLVVPVGDSQLVNLPRREVIRPARDLFALPVERGDSADTPRRDLQQSLQGYRGIASITDAQHAWALVQVPEGGAQRFAVGDTLGEGVITHIDDRSITVKAGGMRSQIYIGRP